MNDFETLYNRAVKAVALRIEAMVQKDARDPELRQILREDYASTVTSDLVAVLTIGRPDSGDREYRRAIQDLAELVEEMVQADAESQEEVDFLREDYSIPAMEDVKTLLREGV